jgi:hypothetical protein
MAGKTDKLFGDAGDWHYNLMLRYGANDFVLLVSGYRESDFLITMIFPYYGRCVKKF